MVAITKQLLTVKRANSQVSIFWCLYVTWIPTLIENYVIPTFLSPLKHFFYKYVNTIP